MSLFVFVSIIKIGNVSKSIVQQKISQLIYFLFGIYYENFFKKQISDKNEEGRMHLFIYIEGKTNQYSLSINEI